MRQDTTLLVNGKDCHSNNLLRLAYFTQFFSCSYFLLSHSHFLTQSFSHLIPLTHSCSFNFSYFFISLTHFLSHSHFPSLSFNSSLTLISSFNFSLTPTSSLNSSLTLTFTHFFSHSHFFAQFLSHSHFLI